MSEKSNKPQHKSGFYQHRGTGAIVELTASVEGIPMIDAFIQVGFEYVGKTEPKKAKSE